MVKNPPVNVGDAGDVGLIPGLGRFLRVGNGRPLQHSRLENSTDRGVWKSTIHGVTKSQTRLSTHAHMHNKQQQKSLAKNWGQ